MSDDEGDFKKARGFLLSYSAIVLALWFFGAKLTAFKLMGTEIQLEHRTTSVWLVLACLNVYFWLRFLQHIPSGAFRFDAPMHDLYDRALVTAAIWRKHFELRESVKRTLLEKHGPNEQAKFVRGYAQVTCYDKMEQDRREHPEAEYELYQYGREVRTEMHVSAYYLYTDNGGTWVPFGDHVRLGAYVPSKALTWTVKTYVVGKGALLTPWFTNNIFPLLIGGVSTGIAVWNWWQINHATIIG